MSASEGEHGGYKEIIAKFRGDGVYGDLKFESGGSRITCSCYGIAGSYSYFCLYRCGDAELPDAELPDINPADLRIDTFRS